MADYTNINQEAGAFITDLGPQVEEVIEKQQNWESLLKGIKNSTQIRKTHSALMSANKFLDKTNAYMDQGLKMLEFGNTIVGLFKVLEMALAGSLWSLVSYVIDQIQLVIDDFKSTGVYFIEFVTCFMDQPEAAVYEESSTRGPWYLSDEAIDGEIEGSKKTLVDIAGEKLYDKIVDGTWGMTDIGNIMLAFKQQHQGFYKPTTYNEFINVVVNAFYDHNDNPSKKSLEMAGNAAFDILSGDVDGVLKQNSTVARLLKPGRPMFSDTADSWAFMVMFAIKDPFPLLNILGLLSELMDINIGHLKDVWDYLPFSEASNVNKDFNEATRRSKEIKDNIYKEITNIIDLNKDDKGKFKAALLSLFQDLLSDDANIPMEYQGTHPDFYGVTLYSIWPQGFNKLESLLNNIKKNLWRPEVSGISNALSAKIQGLVTFIESIQNTVHQIQQIIRFIDSFLALTDVFVINIKTSQGVSGILDQLNNAEGIFDTQKFKNQLRAAKVPEDRIADLVGLDSKNITADLEDIKEHLKESLEIQNTEVQSAFRAMEDTKDNIQHIQDLKILSMEYNYALDEAGYGPMDILLQEAQINYKVGMESRQGIIDTYYNTHNKYKLSNWIGETDNLVASIDESEPNDYNSELMAIIDEIQVIMDAIKDIDELLALWEDDLFAPDSFEVLEERERLELSLASLTNPRPLIPGDPGYIGPGDPGYIGPGDPGYIKPGDPGYIGEILVPGGPGRKQIYIQEVQNKIISMNFITYPIKQITDNHLQRILLEIENTEQNILYRKDIINGKKNDIFQLFNTYYNSVNGIIFLCELNIESKQSEINVKSSELAWAEERVLYYNENNPVQAWEIEERDRALLIVGTYGDIIIGLELDVQGLELDLVNYEGIYNGLRVLWEGEIRYEVNRNLDNWNRKEILLNWLGIVEEELGLAEFKADMESYIGNMVNTLMGFVTDKKAEFGVLDWDILDAVKYGFDLDVIGYLDVGSLDVCVDAYREEYNRRDIIYMKAVEGAEKIVGEIKDVEGIDAFKLGEVDKIMKEWTPDTKMFYGGALLCMGKPTFDVGHYQKTFDMSTIFKKQFEHSKGVVGKGSEYQDAKKTLDKIKKYF